MISLSFYFLIKFNILVIQVYVEADLLTVQTLGVTYLIDPEGKNLDIKILETWFNHFSKPMLEVFDR
jgi:hypothetical protein